MSSLIYGFLQMRRALVKDAWKRYSEKNSLKNAIEQNRTIQEQQLTAFLSD